jgi:hypothetical protein
MDTPSCGQILSFGLIILTAMAIGGNSQGAKRFLDLVGKALISVLAAFEDWIRSKSQRRRQEPKDPE